MDAIAKRNVGLPLIFGMCGFLGFSHRNVDPSLTHETQRKTSILSAEYGSRSLRNHNDTTNNLCFFLLPSRLHIPLSSMSSLYTYKRPEAARADLKKQEAIFEVGRGAWF